MINRTFPSGFQTLALLGAFSLASLAFTGCMTQEEATSGDFASDGQGAFLVTEMDQMGQTLDELTSDELPSAALGKSAADLVITGELVIDPFSYREDCRCFVRRARFTGSRGYERLRLDSVTFLDSAGAPMDSWKPAGVAKIVYSRDVEREKGAREVQVRIDVTVDIKVEDGGRVGVWNGAMTGAFNGQEFKSGVIANVVRPLAGGHFGFPESGTMELTRPAFHFFVEFLGDGKAKVKIRNRRTGRIHVLWVDKDYRETEPVAE